MELSQEEHEIIMRALQAWQRTVAAEASKLLRSDPRAGHILLADTDKIEQLIKKLQS